MAGNSTPSSYAGFGGGSSTPSAPPDQTGKKLADRAKDVKRILDQVLKTAADKSGMLKIVVHGAQIVCDKTIPAMKPNKLMVPDPRPLAEGMPVAAIQDVIRGKNIKPWPCKCKLRPSKGDHLPCDYKPGGVWTPPIMTETVGTGSPQLAVPEIARHRCAIGGTISIIDPGQHTKKGKLGGPNSMPSMDQPGLDGELMAMNRGMVGVHAAGICVTALNTFGAGGGILGALNLAGTAMGPDALSWGTMSSLTSSSCPASAPGISRP